MIEKFVEIVEDKAALELGLRVIMEVAETKVLPPVGVLPTFNNEFIADMFNKTLELVAGKKFPEDVGDSGGIGFFAEKD